MPCPPATTGCTRSNIDGYRALIAVAGGEAKVFTRTGLDWTDKFAPLADALAALDLPLGADRRRDRRVRSDGNPDFSTLKDAEARPRRQT